MPLNIVRNDITRMTVDAIVNSTNSRLIPGGRGVDASIHRAAGPGLRQELERIGHCPIGSAVVTGAYELPCRYIIHTAGPVWKDGHSGEKELLRSCYESVLNLAEEKGCSSVAVPVLSAGAYGYPEREAFQLAADTIREWLGDKDITVYLVVFGSSMTRISGELFEKVARLIDTGYVRKHRESMINAYEEQVENAPPRPQRARRPGRTEIDETGAKPDFEADICLRPAPRRPLDPAAAEKKSSRRKSFLPDFLHDKRGAGNYVLDEGFGEAMLRLMEEKNISSADMCKRANISKAVLSNLRLSVPGGSKAGYKPTKQTAVAVGIALRLDFDELNEFISKAGYVLSRSIMFDSIIECCVRQNYYDVLGINCLLFEHDQVLLGSSDK